MNIPASIRDEFPLQDGLIYLNHAAVSPWPRRVTQSVKDFADENMTQGSLNYPDWVNTETSLRQRLQQLINAPAADDIALLKNTSEALSVVAYGLDWQDGDNVVISDQEFPSNRLVWQSLQRLGVTVKIAKLDMAATAPEQALIDCCDERTRLLSVSSIQFASGLRINLESLGHHCRKNDILFCVDAIQSLGAVEFDVQAINADFVMADGHKWMLGPEGVALFYCAAGQREKLMLNQYGWHMTEDFLNFDQQDWRPAASGRRFECGSPNMLGIHALNASLSLLLEVGMTAIERQILYHTRLMADFINRSSNLSLITPDRTGQYGGIVAFRHHTVDPDSGCRQLAAQNISCASRGGCIRFSPHFYTREADILHALEVANQL